MTTRRTPQPDDPKPPVWQNPPKGWQEEPGGGPRYRDPGLRPERQPKVKTPPPATDLRTQVETTFRAVLNQLSLAKAGGTRMTFEQAVTQPPASEVAP